MTDKSNVTTLSVEAGVDYTRIVGLYCYSKTALDALDDWLNQVEWSRACFADPGPFYRFEMPCGQVIEYATRDDFPRVTTPCPCGDPKHIVVQIDG